MSDNESNESRETVADIIREKREMSAGEKCPFCKKPLKRGERRICRRCAALWPSMAKVERSRGDEMRKRRAAR